MTMLLLSFHRHHPYEASTLFILFTSSFVRFLFIMIIIRFVYVYHPLLACQTCNEIFFLSYVNDAQYTQTFYFANNNQINTNRLSIFLSYIIRTRVRWRKKNTIIYYWQHLEQFFISFIQFYFEARIKWNANNRKTINEFSNFTKKGLRWNEI